MFHNLVKESELEENGRAKKQSRDRDPIHVKQIVRVDEAKLRRQHKVRTLNCCNVMKCYFGRNIWVYKES